MSAANQIKLDYIIAWATKIIVGVSAFLIVTLVNEIRSDVKSVILNQQEQREKIRRIERVIDRIEDNGIR